MSTVLTHPVSSPQIVDFCRPEYLGQVKMDGTRLAVVFGDDCQPEYALTKNEIKVRVPELGLPRMAPGTVIDGELLGTGTWQSAQSALRLAFLGESVPCSWAAFDIILDPLGVTEEPGFIHRVKFLQDRGFPVVPTGEVEDMWSLVTERGAEGVVVRHRYAQPGHPLWKIKAPQVINVIVLRGKGMLIKASGQPAVVCSLAQPDGLYQVACEGVSSTGKLRAARVLGPAMGENVSYAQLGDLRK